MDVCSDLIKIRPYNWFKLQLWMWLAYWKCDNNLASASVEKRSFFFKTIAIEESVSFMTEYKTSFECFFFIISFLMISICTICNFPSTFKHCGKLRTTSYFKLAFIGINISNNSSVRHVYSGKWNRLWTRIWDLTRECLEMVASQESLVQMKRLL